MGFLNRPRGRRGPTPARSQKAAEHESPGNSTVPTNSLVGMFKEATTATALAQQTGDRATLDAAIAAWDRTLAHPDFSKADALVQVTAICYAGGAYELRYRATGQMADLNQAVKLRQEALPHIPPESPELGISLDALGKLLHDRYRINKQPQDLANAVDIFRRASRVTPVEPAALARRLHNLGIVLRDRYRDTEQLDNLDEAIRVFRHAAELVSNDGERQATYLGDLGYVLSLRGEAVQSAANLAEAVQVFRQCVALTPPDAPAMANRQSSLNAALEAAVRSFGRAAQQAANTPDATIYLAGLGDLLLELYDRTGDMTHLNVAVEALGKAVQHTPVDSADRPRRLDALGRGLRRRCSLGHIEDLEASIQALREAVQRTGPDALDDRLDYLNNLGNSLYDRYELSGDDQDLTELLEIRQGVAQDTSADSPRRPNRLNNLGLAIRSLYVRTGKIEDLDEAIKNFRAAKDQSPSPVRLGNLGQSLADRYDLVGCSADLEEAIQVLREAVVHTPAGAPDRPWHLTNLAESLRRRSRANTENRADLEEAIELAREAIRGTPLQSPDRPAYLNILGNCLSDRYAHNKQQTDLDETVAAYQQAVADTPEQSPSLPAYRNNLATALADRYRTNQSTEDWQAAQAEFRRAFQLGKERMPEEAVRSVDNWYSWAFKLQAWDAVIEAYHSGQQNLELLMGRQLQREDKEAWLGKVQGLSACAAYSFAKLNRREEAVAALEAGRARLLTEALEEDQRYLRHLSELGQKEVYERYCRASERLQALERVGVGTSKLLLLPGGYLGLRKQQEAAQRELAAAVADIRQVSDYKAFRSGMPGFESVQKAVPEDATLVYILSTALGGLALIVHRAKGQDVEAVWLDRLTDTSVREQLEGPPNDPAPGGYLGAYAASQEMDVPAVRDAWHTAIKTTAHWLWETLMGPVVEQLGRGLDSRPTAHPEDQGRNRPPGHMILVPVGVLGMLPLHLAWREAAGQERCVLDDFVVSYAPGAQALGIARSRTAALEHQPHRLLAFVNPSGDLPFTQVEAQQVAGCFPDAATQTLLLLGKEAIQEALKEFLPGRSYLHFACHGRHDPREVLNSHLMLAQGDPLELREILDGSFALDGTRLITLSACDSGLIDIRRVPDEVVGLPAGFLQAGAPGVISTLWAVNDLSTALLMGEFYRRHLEKGQSVAEALCGAQLWLRDATAKEMKLAAYYEEAIADSGKQDPRAFAWQRYWASHPCTKAFAEPYYWAPFVFTGA